MMFAATLQAQDYGALKHMLQKRPANEKFESNKFNEHLFFSAGIGKWFSRFSGLRLSGTVGLYAERCVAINAGLHYCFRIKCIGNSNIRGLCNHGFRVVQSFFYILLPMFVV